MLLNYVKVALRLMWRHRGYTAINIVSLALGLACSILLLSYVRYELSYDRYHEKKDRVVRMALTIPRSSYGSIAKVNGPYGPAVQGEVPEIEAMTRFVFSGNLLLGSGERRFYESDGLYADPAAFQLFSFELLEGDAEKALAEPNTIVLTESLVKKYFPQGNPLGQSLMMENTIPLRVTGVLRDVPLNSHFTFDYLLSMGTLRHPDRDDWWRWNQFYTYLLLRPGADGATVEAKATSVIRSHLGDQGSGHQIFFQPITSIHLYSNLFRELEPNSDIAYVYLMSAIAFFILIIASMNFVNISTARASLRAKEVGIRKATGADRRAVSMQFFGESLLLSLMGLPLAVALVELALPGFNDLASRSITIEWLSDPFPLVVSTLLTLVVGAAAGVYPSLVLSSFNPAVVLKGDQAGGRGSSFRKILVVTQFGLSAAFLIATSIVFDQLNYMKVKRLGFNDDQVIVIPMTDPTINARSELIKAELRKNPAVLSVAATANLPGGGDYGIPAELVGVPAEQAPPIRVLIGDHDLLPTLQVEMVAGRHFSSALASDSGGYILNEAAVEQIGWENPLNERIAMPAIHRQPGPVIGIARDFHFRGFREAIAPLMIFIAPGSDWFSSFIVRVRPEQVPEVLTYLEEKFGQFDPLHPFRYRFLDETFQQLRDSEERMSRLLTVASGLATVIACLGLFGLAVFSAEQRTKEIGVRKVLGASVPGIAAMMTKDFLKLVLIANIIAWPFAWYGMSIWLEDFAYRADINAVSFLVVTLASALIAVFTVSYQALRAGLMNPVKALRYE
jgi:putative ABC transport system permease protein